MVYVPLWLIALTTALSLALGIMIGWLLAWETRRGNRHA